MQQVDHPNCVKLVSNALLMLKKGNIRHIPKTWNVPDGGCIRHIRLIDKPVPALWPSTHFGGREATWHCV